MRCLQAFFSRIVKDKSKIEVSEKLGQENLSTERYLETRDMAAKITRSIKTCNMFFATLTQIPIFTEDIEAISSLHLPCYGADDFKIKIGGLAELFQIDVKKWEPILKNFEPWMKRANTLLLKWLDENNIAYDHKKVKVWDAIIELRNSSFPYHPSNPESLKLIQFFHGSFPIKYPDLYGYILKMFLESLDMLETILFKRSMQISSQN